MDAHFTVKCAIFILVTVLSLTVDNLLNMSYGNKKVIYQFCQSALSQSKRENKHVSVGVRSYSDKLGQEAMERIIFFHKHLMIIQLNARTVLFLT